MTTERPELRLERVLLALERELLSGDDAEILAAAEELGMNLEMKGSAAFIGVKTLVGLRYPEDTEHKPPAFLSGLHDRS
jgi:hypothetical protein